MSLESLDPWKKTATNPAQLHKSLPMPNSRLFRIWLLRGFANTCLNLGSRRVFSEKDAKDDSETMLVRHPQWLIYTMEDAIHNTKRQAINSITRRLCRTPTSRMKARQFHPRLHQAEGQRSNAPRIQEQARSPAGNTHMLSGIAWPMDEQSAFSLVVLFDVDVASVFPSGGHRVECDLECPTFSSSRPFFGQTCQIFVELYVRYVLIDIRFF